MSLRIISIPESNESTENPPTFTRFYKAIGTDNAALVRLTMQTGSPLTVLTVNGTLFRQDIVIRKTAFHQFDVTVNYGAKAGNRQAGNKTGLQPGEWTWEFDTTGYVATLRQSRRTVARYRATNDPAATQPDVTVPTQNGAINVENGEVKGVDIIIPGMNLVITQRSPAGVVTLELARTLMQATPSVNSQPWLGYEAGEVLYKGTRGSDGTETDAVLVHSFEISPNVTGLSFGDDLQPQYQISNIDKRGHDYIWVKHEEELIDGPYDPGVPGDFIKVPAMIPKYVYVEEVYAYSNFASFLGFG